MSEDTTSWQELREFKAVDLTESFVLSWDVSADSLCVDVDLYLCQAHPFYERPRPSERACFRPAHIEFPRCSSITMAEGDTDKAIANVSRQLLGGKISDFCRSGEGQYKITGDFGVIAISSERPMVRLKDQTI